MYVVTLNVDLVNLMVFCGSKITGCTQSAVFSGSGNDCCTPLIDPTLTWSVGK